MPFQSAPSLCPICKEGKQFSFIRDFQKESENYSLYQCLQCQVQFWLPIKTIGATWYEVNNPYQIRDLTATKLFRGYHKEFLKKYPTFTKGTRVLDLGCGTGEFIAQLKKRGCDVTGLDFDKNGIEIAKQRFGLENVFAISFEDFFAKTDIAKFDIITFFEVIEHLEDPLSFLMKAEKLLKPNGKMVLSTPYKDRIMPNFNLWDFPPHHFTRWNSTSLSNIFSKIGFSLQSLLYVEEFKILAESVGSIFQTGLVRQSLKTAHIKNKSLLIPKIIYLLGKCKSVVLGTVPTVFVFGAAKIMGRHNGTMLAEFTRKND